MCDIITNMKTTNSGIYCITNKINGKKYIGQSLDISKRWSTHITKKSNSAVFLAIKKYGRDNFIFEILLYCCKEWMNFWECNYIAKYNSVAPNGYNLTHGGNANQILSDVTKCKISESLMGNIPWNKGKNYKAKPLSEEHKAKISKSLDGHPSNELSEEKRIEMSNKHSGTGNPFFGKKHTDEFKERQRQNKLGKSTWNKGKEHTPEHKENLRLAWIRRRERMNNDKTTD